MKKERFEARLFRIFAQAGYSPVQLLTVTPEEWWKYRESPYRISALCCVCRIRCWQSKTIFGPENWWRNFCKRPKKAGGIMDKPHVLDILAKNKAALFPISG